MQWYKRHKSCLELKRDPRHYPRWIEFETRRMNHFGSKCETIMSTLNSKNLKYILVYLCFANLQHWWVDIKNGYFGPRPFNRSWCWCWEERRETDKSAAVWRIVEDSKGNVSRTPSHVQDAKVTTWSQDRRIETGYKGILPQAMNTQTHEIIHNITEKNGGGDGK